MISTTIQNNIEDWKFDLQCFAEADAGAGDPTPPTNTDPAPTGGGDPTPPAGNNLGDPAPGTKSLLGAEPKAGTPDAYDDFKLPDNVKWDETTGSEFKTTAKEMGLSQENAQKLVDLGAKIVGGQESAMQKMVTDQSEAWQKESLQQFKQADIDTANKALMQFADKDVISLLQSTGLGNHPLIVGLFNNIGKAMAEGAMPTGAGQSVPSRLYPNSPGMYE
ncbi:hypothetical protein [Pectinatus frisingensis]|uniref:hypothetical protein n=1 Tax=Pectinatus frisingensis TaxID=865 RepID=UPI003D809F4D